MLLAVIAFMYCGTCNPRNDISSYKPKWLSITCTYWVYYLHSSLELTLASSVCALADKRPLSDVFGGLVHDGSPFGGN